MTTPCSRSRSAGLRVGELTSLTLGDLHLGPAAHVTCHGKGRKNRITPLDAQTVAVLHAFTTPPIGTQILFPTRTGTRMSRDAVAKRLTQHAATASMTCSTRQQDRHTTRPEAYSGHEITCRGHRHHGHRSLARPRKHPTTQIYLHADMTAKQTAMDRTVPTGTELGRYRPTDDQLLAFLQGL